MGLAIMIIGLAVFLGSHTFVTMRPSRAALIARLGGGPYKGLFSLASLAGLILIGWGFAIYRTAGFIDIWMPPSWTRHIALLLVWPSIICVVAAYIPGDIKRVLKHPMLVGVKLWAVAHLIANGDLGSIILFGSVLAWAVFDRITLKRRSDAGSPAIPSGGRRNDFFAVALGTLVYFGLGFWFHPWVIGVPVFRVESCRPNKRPGALPRLTSPPARAGIRLFALPPITPIRRGSSTVSATSSWWAILSAW